MAKLIITDSYFNLFPILVERLKNSTNGLSGKNLIFCEEKVSLMAERYICGNLGGSFNTDVYSFGNFLRVKKTFKNALSKEGSAMVVKKILGKVELKCFRTAKANLAPVLFDLIIQLKSARVTPRDIAKASESANGILKNKLTDIATIFSAYEDFISVNGYDDQSSMLSYLPNVIENSEEVKSANVYLVGFSGWTCQIRSAITSLLKTAKSVTAIITDGDNESVYVGETAKVFKSLCKNNGVPLTEEIVDGKINASGKIIVNNLFNPVIHKGLVTGNESVYLQSFTTIKDELTSVAEVIKKSVIDGECRYKDITLTVPDTITYGNIIMEIFDMLDIPYFIDEKKRTDTHPLITFITAYAEVFKRGFERSSVLKFIKNPLFCNDKALTDNFENYIIKYNPLPTIVKKQKEKFSKNL